MKALESEITRMVDSVYEGEKQVLVFGEGPVGARIMLIGEAPGEREAMAGRPFVGRAGKNLDEYIAATGLERDKMYVTNTVKFRPTRISAAGRTVNRPPTGEEIALFLPFLKREIETVNPGVVVTLGNVPLKALAGASATIGECHGQVLDIGGRTLFPMYHPAALIYNRSLEGAYAQDMAKLAILIKTVPNIN